MSVKWTFRAYQTFALMDEMRCVRCELVMLRESRSPARESWRCLMCGATADVVQDAEAKGEAA